MPTRSSDSDPNEPRGHYGDQRDELRELDELAELDELDGELDRVDTVIRLLYTLLFFLIIRVVETAVGLIVAFQLIFALITNRAPNPAVTSFAKRMIEYAYQIGHYVTYNRDLPPFPFDQLPEED